MVKTAEMMAKTKNSLEIPTKMRKKMDKTKKVSAQDL